MKAQENIFGCYLLSLLTKKPKAQLSAYAGILVITLYQ